MLLELQKYVTVESIIPTVGVAVFGYLFSRARSANYPPGPKGLPMLGCVTQLGKHPSNTLTGLAKELGQVFSIQIGQTNWVILNDYDSIHEALLKKGDAFSGRPDVLLLRQMGEGLGVIYADHGPAWKSQRRFAVATLRKFGVGGERLEELLTEEVNYLAEEIASKGGRGIDAQKLFTMAAGNTTNKLVLGTRFSYDDPTYAKLIHSLDRIFYDEYRAPQMLALLVAPVTRFLPGFRDTYKGFCDDLESTFGIIGSLLEQHKDNYDEGDIRDFVHEFLKEMKSRNNKDPSFKERQVFQFIRELFVAGSVNMSSVLSWCFLCFLNYPEYQEKIYREIQAGIGDEVPSMKHKDKMPFTMAFLHEIMRHRTLAPLSMPHKTTVDTNIKEYAIPKDTPVLVNLWAVLHDPEVFKNPEEFRPERFIDADGSFSPSDHVISYSFGPRRCMGNQLAKIGVFLYLVKVVQKFKLVPDPKTPPPRFSDGIFGILYVPPHFDVIFENR